MKLRRPTAVALLLVTTGFTHPLFAAIAIDPLSWGLAPGTTFRLVLVTFGTTAATSTNIATYDTFVNTQNVDQITYNGSTLSWQALGLTTSSSPISDSSRYSSQANSTLVYNLNGQAVSNTTAGTQFWRTTGSSTHLAPINYTINSSGNLALSSASNAWTGFDYNGLLQTTRNYNTSGTQIGTVTAALGQSTAYRTSTGIASTLYPAYGRIAASANGWASIGSNSALSTQYPMYAMSSLITVTAAAVPEPSSYAVIAGLLALATTTLRRPRPSKV